MSTTSTALYQGENSLVFGGFDICVPRSAVHSYVAQDESKSLCEVVQTRECFGTIYSNPRTGSSGFIAAGVCGYAASLAGILDNVSGWIVRGSLVASVFYLGHLGLKIEEIHTTMRAESITDSAGRMRVDENSKFMESILIGIVFASLFSYFLGSLLEWITKEIMSKAYEIPSQPEILLLPLKAAVFVVIDIVCFVVYFWAAYYKPMLDRQVRHEKGLWSVLFDLLILLPACGIPWATLRLLVVWKYPNEFKYISQVFLFFLGTLLMLALRMIRIKKKWRL